MSGAPDQQGRFVYGVTTPLDFLRQARVFVATVFLLSLLAVHLAETQLPEPPWFVVDMRSDTNTWHSCFSTWARG